MRFVFATVICLILVSPPIVVEGQIGFPYSALEITFTKEEVGRMLLDAGATSTAVLDPYPADYEFTEKEVQELLRSIPQDELLEEYKSRKLMEKKEQRRPDELRLQAPRPRAPVRDDKEIRPFGFDVFSYSPLEYSPTEFIAAGPEYVLGPGDELVISMWGAVEKYYEVTINREGNVVLPELGVVPASGATLEGFEERLADRFSGVYSGFKIDVSLAKLRTIQVFVVGDVVRPGAYTISSVSTAFNALYYAGGPTDVGSLRKVLVYRSGKLMATVDLYDFLLTGDTGGDVRLRSGDTVFVTPAEQRVTIKGAVRRPAIYELKGGETVADVVELAGGFGAAAFTERIEIARIDSDSGRTSVVLDCRIGSQADTLDCLESSVVMDGDEIVVYTVWHVHPKEHVSIRGQVQFPGEYPLFPKMRVSDLVFRAGGLLDQAYLLRAEISRIEERPEESKLVSRVMFTNLHQALSAPYSDRDILLESKDKVFVRKIPGWRTQHLVDIDGEVRFPGTYTLERKEERLTYLLERAGGLTPEAFPSAGSVHRKDEGRVIVDFAKALEDPGGRDDLTLADGDSIYIPVYPNTIKVEGAVGRPGSIVFSPGKSAGYYIQRTGGFLEKANKGSVRIVRLDGSTDPARNRFWFDPEVKPGNKIIVELEEPGRGIDWSATIKDATTIAASVATTIYIITRIDE